jgi:hypothetical protein
VEAFQRGERLATVSREFASAKGLGNSSVLFHGSREAHQQGQVSGTIGIHGKELRCVVCKMAVTMTST